MIMYFFQTNITEITLPEKLNHISGIAFLGNCVIKNINVDANNTNFSSSNGIVFSKDKKKIVLYPQGKTEKAYTIPSTVEEICDSAFSYAQVESITIPSSVKKIWQLCFFIKYKINNNSKHSNRNGIWTCRRLPKIDIS